MKPLRMFAGQLAIALEASPALADPTAAGEADDGTKRPRVRGYVQTVEPASKGGKANGNGFRVRPAAMAALAASFATKPFITGHDRGDVRARGGTIRDASLTAPAAGEQAIDYELEVVAAWALEGLANGTIDRFSFSILPIGEITCTVHGTPVFTACYCCPGEMVWMKRGDAQVEVLAEWECEDAEGLELSAVNVPAVDGTGVLSASLSAADRREVLAELSELCGRQHRDLVSAAAPVAMPSSPPAPRPPVVPELAPVLPALPVATFAAELAIALGLSADAAPEQLQARAAQLRATADRATADTDAMHVDAAIERLVRDRDVAADVLVELRATARMSGRAAFDAQASLVSRTAPDRALPIGERGALQSDARPAPTPGDPALDDGRGPDAFEANRSNPELGRLMRIAGVSVADVRQHGSRAFTVLANLRELADATEGAP